MGKEHFLFDANTHTHKCVKGNTEGGACLTGHDRATHTNFGRKHSCNYRYQAVEQARTHNKIQEILHSYNKIVDKISGKEVKTSAYEGKNSGAMTPAHYCSTIPAPRKGDWNVDGPTEGDIERTSFKGKDATVKKGKNFSQDTWPYWNNAHHLIPKGALAMAIVNEGAEVGTLMEKGLLEAGYNINHKRNMLLIPQDKEVGEILDMPRHIQLKECDDPSVSAHCTSHPVYDEMVKTMRNGLKRIIKGYKKTVKDPEKCTKPDFMLDKTKLERLSDKLLKLIIEWEGGRSLDSLAKSK